MTPALFKDFGENSIHCMEIRSNLFLLASLVCHQGRRLLSHELVCFLCFYYTSIFIRVFFKTLDLLSRCFPRYKLVALAVGR